MLYELKLKCKDIKQGQVMVLHFTINNAVVYEAGKEERRPYMCHDL